MTLWVVQLINGLSYGMLLFILAAGMTLGFGLLRIINLAHGSYYLLGGYIGIAVVASTGSFWFAVIVSGAAMAALGCVMWLLLLRRHVTNELATVLLTFGFLLLLGDLAFWHFGGAPQTIPAPPPFDGPVVIGNIRFPAFRLVLLVAGGLTAMFLWWLVEWTRVGMLVRACVNDPQMAQGLGINVPRIMTAVFSLSAGLAGIAGVLGGPLIGVYPGADLVVLLLAIVVVILGGLGSLKGAFLAALIVGLLDTAGRTLFPEFALFAIFAPMALILVIRPAGLLGRS
jgi:branched-chain amino acid transport system permease protein